MRIFLVSGVSWLLKVCFCSLLIFLLVGMGDGAKRNSVHIEPSFAPLEEGEPSLAATIYDETTVTEIHDVSFFGHTSIGGIRKETDDSTNKLDLGKIKEISLVKSTFESKRFRDREFSLIKVIAANGTLVEDLLVPKHVIICGIDKKSQMERSWFLSKIDKVVLENSAKAEAPEVVIGKAFKKEQEKWEKSAPKKGEEKAEAVKVVTEKEMMHVPEQKQPGVGQAANRLWDAVVDVVSETWKTIKGWF